MFSSSKTSAARVLTSTGIDRSAAFDGRNIVRTGTSVGNRRTFTSSFWVKRAYDFVAAQTIFISTPTTDNRFFVQFSTTGTLTVNNTVAGTNTVLLQTNQVFRDPTAWYHIVLGVNTTLGVGNTRVRLYVNGVELTSVTRTNPAQNTDLSIDHTTAFRYGENHAGAAFLRGYLSNIQFVDGLQLTPTSFGEFDAITGIWKAIAYTGSYGTNGHWLTFSDFSSTASTAGGRDYSGNNNHFTLSNFTTSDLVADSPLNNFAILNAVDLLASDGTAGSVAGAGLRAITSVGTGSGVCATIPVNIPAGGKYYWEVTLVSGVTTATGAVNTGLIGASAVDNLNQGTSYFFTSSTSPTYTNGDILGFRFDQTLGTLEVYKNNTLATTLTGITDTSIPLFPAIRDNLAAGAVTADFNFGQRPFAYSLPSGFTTLSTSNTAEPAVVRPLNAFDTLLYTGNGNTRSITGLNFSPDIVWIKGRNVISSHRNYDSVRGATRELSLNADDGEATVAQSLTAFNADGFSLGTATNANATGTNYVASCWDESVTDGLDIITYTGNGSNRTIAHNLGVAPKMMIIKSRSGVTPDQGWAVYHSGMVNANTNYMLLESLLGATSATNVWNSTAPTSSVFSLGTNALVNTNNATYVAYLWSEVPGFSRFSHYIGNGQTNGTFIWCGFRPAFVLTKQTTGTDRGWSIYDSKRSVINPVQISHAANSDATEGNDATQAIDFLATGFKFRGNASWVNQSGNRYIFAAFAEVPFKYGLAR